MLAFVHGRPTYPDLNPDRHFIYYICEEKIITSKEVAYQQGDPLLSEHGSRFVCILYFLAKGLRDNGIDSDRVYTELNAGAFPDQQLARRQLVQYLEDLQVSPIKFDKGTNTVSLTREGSQWAQRQCENRPYSDYRYLQN